jgi:uncharacterized protein YjiS (DUF1127 family)
MEALRLRRHWLELRGIAVVGILSRLLDRLWEWRGRSRERRHLASLTDALLKDIGISRADAAAEFEKPFWRR